MKEMHKSQMALLGFLYTFYVAQCTEAILISDMYINWTIPTSNLDKANFVP